ncbi:MAG: hypothetical protein HY037_01820, partial [Nitrospirae bacterium]|nr:hypothetical protein [Candidatus Troglogloeales bacterium]
VNGIYTVTPSKTGFTFSPVSRTFTINGANITGMNFTATATTAFPASTTRRASSGNTGQNSGTEISVTAPAGTAAGDLVSLIIVSNDDASGHTDHNGATAFTQDLAPSLYGTGGGYISVWSRRIQAGDPGVYRFTLNFSSSRWTIIAVTWQNPNSSKVYDVTPVFHSYKTVGSCSADTITTTTNNAIHVAFASIDGALNTFSSTPIDYTVEQNVDGQRSVYTDKVIAPPGATGAPSFELATQQFCGTVSFAIANNN